MIAQTPLILRSHEGPSRLEASENLVPREQGRVVEDIFPHADLPVGEMTVDFFPFSVVFDCSVTPGMPEVIVEISHGYYPPRTGRKEGVCYGLHPGKRRQTPVRLPADLGRVVVDHHGEAVEACDEDIPCRQSNPCAVPDVHRETLFKMQS